jgi:malic enzyme
MAVVWIKPPSTIARVLAQRTAACEAGLRGNAQSYASRGQSQMVAGAPWNDQTGYARASLFGRAEGTDVVLGTTNGEYGPFLELGTSKMEPRPIIVPTANELAPPYFQDSAQIVTRTIGGR